MTKMFSLSSTSMAGRSAWMRMGMESRLSIYSRNKGKECKKQWKSKEVREMRKKCLLFPVKDDILPITAETERCKAPQRSGTDSIAQGARPCTGGRKAWKRLAPKVKKEFQKTWKNLLTKRETCGIISERSRERARKTSEKAENRNLTGERKRPRKKLEKSAWQTNLSVIK